MPVGMADADPPRLRPHRCERGDDAPRRRPPLCELAMSGEEKYADDPGRWIAWINTTDATPVSGEFCAHRRAPGGLARPQLRPVAVARETEIGAPAVDQRPLGAHGEMAGDDDGPGTHGTCHHPPGTQEQRSFRSGE